MSNGRRLRRPAKRAAARAVAAASQCPDCGARAARPRRDRRDWVIDVQHDESCPSRRLRSLRDGIGLAAVRAAQPQLDFPIGYVRGAGVVIAGD